MLDLNRVASFFKGPHPRRDRRASHRPETLADVRNAVARYQEAVEALAHERARCRMLGIDLADDACCDKIDAHYALMKAIVRLKDRPDFPGLVTSAGDGMSHQAVSIDGVLYLVAHDNSDEGYPPQLVIVDNREIVTV